LKIVRKLFESKNSEGNILNQKQEFEGSWKRLKAKI